MVICIPSGSTNVGDPRRARLSAEHAGGREVYMIYEPMAAALGAGLDVGGARKATWSSTSAAARRRSPASRSGGIVCSSRSTRRATVFTGDIQSYVRQQHNIRIGERARPRRSKCSIGAAVSDLENEPEDFVVTGPNMPFRHCPNRVASVTARSPMRSKSRS